MSYSFSSMNPNICSKQLGMIPAYSGMEGTPSMVCVLPHPVYPYAKMVPLYPLITDSTSGNALSSYTVYYLESVSYTESNANYLGASPCRDISIWLVPVSTFSTDLQPLSFSVLFIGLTLTMTLTVSVLLGLDINILN